MLTSRLLVALMSFPVWLVMISCFSCNQNHGKYSEGTPYYFGSFSSYYLPCRPVEMLTEEQAKLRKAYYVAYFNKDGKIVSFTKYLDGEFDFCDKYFYDSDGRIERREMTNEKGEIGIGYFDKKGQLIVPGIRGTRNSGDTIPNSDE